MRMATNVIGGTILILLGLSILLKALFGIDIPLSRFVMAGLLIYAGVSLLSGPKMHCTKEDKKNIVFDEQTIMVTGSHPSCFNICFGKVTLDCTDITPSPNSPLMVSVTCGAATIKINKNMPVKIVINTCLANVELPTTDTVAVGTYTYLSHDPLIKPLLTIEATIVMGSLKVEQYNSLEAY